MKIREHFINDIFIAEPYEDFKSKKKIISDLENMKRNGYIIKGLEVDDQYKCVIYRIPNKVSN